jgi:hypothetical protein
MRTVDRLLVALPASMAEEFVSNLNTIVRAFSAERAMPAQDFGAERIAAAAVVAQDA